MVNAGLTDYSPGDLSEHQFSHLENGIITRALKKIQKKAPKHQHVWLLLIYLDLSIFSCHECDVIIFSYITCSFMNDALNWEGPES